MVLVGQGPQDPLGPEAGNGDRHRPTGPEHADQFREGSAILRHVLEYLRGDDPVEGTRPERQGSGVRHHGGTSPAQGRGARFLVGDGLQQAVGVLDLAAVRVERGYHCTPSHRFEGVPPAAAPQVQKAVSGSDAEARRSERSASHRRTDLDRPVALDEPSVVVDGGGRAGLPRESLQDALTGRCGESGR